MDSRAKELIKQGDALFQKRLPLMSLWQEISENFYPERADFTAVRTLGEDFAAHRRVGAFVRQRFDPARIDLVVVDQVAVQAAQERARVHG